MEKNVDLLRSFNLAAAEAGEPICWSHIDADVKFIAGYIYNDYQMVVTEDGEGKQGRHYSQFRMKPLAWVEGKPVYKDDVLYHRVGKMTVTGANECGSVIYFQESISNGGNFPHNCTWNAPKTKKEG